MKDLSDKRIDYNYGTFSITNSAEDPFQQFFLWYEEIEKLPGIIEPNAMALATVNSQGAPSVRMLLLKGYNKEGFSFFTNYQSRKGCELEINDRGALLFYWPDLERQIRIEGQIKKVAEKISDDYFYSRPLGSRVSAIISNQSREIEQKQKLEEEHAQLLAKTAQNETIAKRPENWGGYILIPNYFEFWQGRKNRLHDRVSYKFKDNQWNKAILAP